MSGIVAGYGRGKYNSGIFQKGKVILAQNYFEADKGEATKSSMKGKSNTH